MVHPQIPNKGFKFSSVTQLLSRYCFSSIVSAIEQQGVYVLDEHGRCIEAENDIGKGWFHQYNPETFASTTPVTSMKPLRPVKHLGVQYIYRH